MTRGKAVMAKKKQAILNFSSIETIFYIIFQNYVVII